jgi:hypothetical protein
MSTNRTAIRLLFAALLALPLSAFAAGYDVKAFIDTDNKRATGCSAVLQDGTNVSGIDTILNTFVTVSGGTGTVTAVTRQTCVTPSLNLFSGAVPVDGGWNVSVSPTGDLLIESHLGPNILTMDNVGTPRFVFTTSSGLLSDILLQPFSTGGGDIILPHAARDRAVSTHPLRTITLDGNGADWAGEVPLANGSANQPALRFISVQGYAGSSDFFFNYQIHTNPAAPTAHDDSYDLPASGTLTVATLGVLNNDTPNGQSITSQLLDNPQHGTVALSTNGAFTYISDGSKVAQDQFHYYASGTLPSNVATVTVGTGTTKYTFTSADHITFTAGFFNTFKVVVTGKPTPGLSEDGVLPVGVTFVDNGDGTATLSGTPTAGATYPLIFHAEKNKPHQEDQSFTLTVTQGPVITSAPGTTFIVGSAGSFAVTANGFPAPTITESGALPSGVTFNSASATLSGVPAPGTGGQYSISFTASNSQGSDTQPFLLTVNETPSFTSANNVHLQAGTPANFTVTTLGFPKPAITKSGTLPAGVTFTDNGNGTATLGGTPSAGSGGTYVLDLSAANVVGTAHQNPFTIVVCNSLVVNNPATTTGTANAAFSQTFTQVGAVGTATFALNSGTLPPGLALSTAGVLSGTPTQTGSFPITVKVTDSNGCIGIGSTYTLVINCQTITVTNPATNTGTANTAFSQTFTAGNTIGAVTFSTASTLPAGLTLSAAGVLSGTPTQTGTFPIVVKATDANGCFGNGATYSLTIACQVITVNNPATNSGTVNIAFSQTFTATNTIGATTFTTASTLPAGLTLSAAGVLSGTPTQTGTFPIVVKATDANGCFGNGATYNLTIACQVITVNKPVTTSGTVNVAFSQNFTATNAIGAVTYTTASTLPTGITLATNGTLSGTPTQTGTFPIVVTATDANGCTGTSTTYNLTIGCQVITVNKPATTTGTVNIAFSQAFTSSNTIGAVTYATASTLPTGLTLATNGTLSGTPTQSGSFPIVVTATDGNGCSGSSTTYTLVIGCQVITVTNPATNTGTVNTVFGQTFTAGNTIGTVTFTTASTLPAGLTLSTGGILSGTPTQSGSFPIVVTATDANGCSGNGSTYTLTIGCQVISVTNPATTTGTVNAAFTQTFTAGNTVGTVTFTTASTLPAGLTLSTGGVLSGTPTQTGSFPIVVTATDGNGCSGSGATYTLVIGCQTITVTNPATNTGTVSAPFTVTFTSGNTIGTVTYTTASTLPAGITLATNGTLSGTPTQSGSFPIVVTATDANGCSGNGATYTLVIGCQTITVGNPATTSSPAGTPLSINFTQSGAIGTATFTTASTLPTGLTLATNGTLSGTPSQGGAFPITVTVTDSNGCTGTNSAYTLTITCPVIAVTNPGVTTGTVNIAFSQTFTQTGGIGTTTFSLFSGTLPTGLSLATNGTLSGTPTQTGSFPLVIRATDSNGCTGDGSTYTLVIGCQVITVTNPVTNTGTVNAAFSQTFTAGNAILPVTFSLNSGTLPAGLTLSSGGVLSGTPTQSGSFPITVKATDTNGCFGISATYTLTIGCQTITVTNPATTTGTVNAAFNQTFTAGNTIGTVSFTTASTLPTGLTLSTGGVLSGTPTQSGSFPIVVTATDGNGCTGTGATYTLVIGCQTITVTNPATNTGTVSAPFTVTFTSANTIGTVTYTTASTLPAGLTLSTAGVLSGTPTQSGSFPIVVKATDANGCFGNGSTYTLVISCQTITVGNPATTSSPAGTPLSITFTQTGAIGTATFTTASTLPTGLTLATNGTLSGTPTQGGAFPIVVTVTDSNGCTGTNPAYTLTITCPTITVTNPGVSSGTAGVAFSQTFTQVGGQGTTNFSINSGTLPTGLSLSAAGVLSGTPTQTGSFPITVKATDSNGCTGVGSTYTLVIACQTITVTNPGVTTGTAGTAFSQTFTQTGAIGGATFSINSGSLPTGLSLAAGGVLSGTPTQTGSFPITVKVTDGNGCTGVGATYTLVIACQTITVTKPATTTGTIQVAFSQTFTQTGAIGGATFTLNSGTLPAGLTLSTAGVLSGTPTVTGSFPITVLVTDGNGCTGVTSSYPLVINCQTITVTNPATTTGTVSAPFTQTFTQTGANGTATFTTASTLPAGLTLSTAGVLAGTPTQSGTFPIVVTVTDSNGCTGTGATYTLIIGCQVITVTNPATTTGTVGSAFSQTFTQTGGIGTITWSKSGAIPAGMTFHPTTGILDGTPTQSGSFPITVTATDQNLCAGTGATYTLVVACQVITVTNPGVSTGTVDAAFSQTFTQSGAIGTATFTINSGSLPSGLSLASTGVVSGTPLVPGSFPITVKVTDSNGCTGISATYTLVIACQTITVNAPGVTTGTVDAPFSQTFTQTGVGTHTPAVFTINSGTLPSGLTLSTAGVLSGTPLVPGSFPITVKVTDANGCTGISATYTLVIACQTITVTNPATTSSVFNVALVAANFTFTQSGVGTHTPAVFTINTGTLPAGLSLSTAGVLSGTPTQTGTFPITVKVTDANGCTGIGATYNLAITPNVGNDAYGTVNALVDNTQAYVTGGATATPGTPAVQLSGSVLANDFPTGGVSITSGTFATTQGGSVLIQSDGTFLYTPSVHAAAVASDSFTYTGTSNTGGTATPTSAVGTVNLTLANRVWYVKDNGGAGNGQSQTPFNTLAAVQAAAKANDIIFVYLGTTATTPLAGGLSLQDGAKLWGEGFGLTVNTHALVPAGTQARIKNTAGAAVTVDTSAATAGNRQNVEIKGLDLESTTTNGVNVTSNSTNITGVTIASNNIRGAGTQGINLNQSSTGAFDATITATSITSVGNGIQGRTNTAGTMTITTSANTITTSAGNGVDIRTLAGASALRIALDSEGVTASGTGILIDGSAAGTTTITSFLSNSISGNTGGTGISVTTAIFDATPGNPFNVISGGNTVIGASGNGVGAGGLILTTVKGDLSFTDLDIVTAAGAGLSVTTPAPLTAFNAAGGTGFQIVVPGGTANIDASGGPAVSLNTVTGTLPFVTIKSASSASTGVALNSFLGSFSAGSSSTITMANAAGTSFQVGSSNATITYDGTIVNTNGKGVDLTSNNGSTISFTGQLTLSSTTNNAFFASGVGPAATTGGTVTATNTNNTLTTTTGTALSITNTTIGAGGLIFKTVNANGGPNGIVLNNTGTTAGLTVNGDGSNTSVGGNSTGGTISNTAGANGAIAGSGVYLKSTKNVVLRRMTINGTNQNFGIRGFSVDGFTLEYSTVNGTNGGSNNAFPDDTGEGSIYFGNTVTTGIITSGLFTNNSISGGAWDNMHIENTSGTATITVKGNTFGLNGTSGFGNISFSAMGRGASTMNMVVGGPGAGELNTFTGAPGGLANFTNQTGSTMDVQFIKNAMSNGHPNNNVGGGCLTLATQGVMTFTADGNSMRDANGSTVTIQKASAGTSMQGKFINNTIGVTGVLKSGGGGGAGPGAGNGIFLSCAGGGTIGLTITGNQIRNWFGNGAMWFDNTGGTYTTNFTITGNTIAEPGSNSQASIAITSGGTGVAGDTINVCATIGGAGGLKNIITGAGGLTDVYLGATGAASGSHSFNLPTYAGGANLTNVQNFVTANNTISGGATVIAYADAPNSAAGFTGVGSSCPTP